MVCCRDEFNHKPFTEVEYSGTRYLAMPEHFVKYIWSFLDHDPQERGFYLLPRQAAALRGYEALSSDDTADPEARQDALHDFLYAVFAHHLSITETLEHPLMAFLILKHSNPDHIIAAAEHVSPTLATVQYLGRLVVAQQIWRRVSAYGKDHEGEDTTKMGLEILQEEVYWVKEANATIFGSIRRLIHVAATFAWSVEK